jgi:hypothetical protein
MTVAVIKSNWNNGTIIALITLIESIFKLSFASTELVFGHFKNASPNETRSEHILANSNFTTF